MSRWGIDYAWHEVITAKEARALKTAGVTFAGRYFSRNVDSKNLTGAEEKALSAVGIDTVCFWESTATEAENGYAAGVSDAKRCLELARAVGMPDDRPFYFAIDADVSIGGSIQAYFKGVASVLGLDRTGVYGGYNQVKALFDLGLVRWGFQTYAWSAGKWDHRAQFHQYSNGHVVAGISCDYDTAVAADFGQWRIGHDPATKPKPSRPPAKPPVKPVVHPPKPPRDLCGAWPYGAHDFLGETEPRNAHCHSGVLPKDHKNVEGWQLQMRERGWTLDAHGTFNARSEQVCREFQKQKGIAITGKVNHLTWHHARRDPVTAK